MINTKCEKCIFKVVSQENKQTGCKIHMDEILQENYPGLYSSANIDRSEKSWVLKNFKCPYARTQEWLEILQKTTNDDPISRTIIDSVIPYYLVILMNSEHDDIDDIINDILSNKIYYPQFISFILTDRSCYKPAQLVKLIEQYDLSKWKVHYITDNDLTISEMVDMSLDTNLSSTKASFIFIKYADTLYKTETVKRINEIINHSIGKKVTVITDNFIDGFVSDVSLYLSLDKKIGVVYDYIINDTETYKIKML
jgi:hypothetical protein